MMSEADRQIVARESAIPGLRLLLDQDALRERLTRDCRSADITEIRVDYLRYKPQTSCLARLRIRTSHRDLFAYAKACRHDAVAKLAKAASLAQNIRTSSYFIADKSLAVYFFPQDRGLKSLPRTQQTQSLTSLLGRIAPELVSYSSAQVETLQYKPERRYVAKLLVDGHPAASIKLFTRNGYELARRAAKTIGGVASLPIARCIGHSNSNAALAFEWVDATPLSQIDLTGKASGESIRELARALHVLHRQRCMKLPTRSAEQIAKRLSTLGLEIAWLAPELASRAARLSDEFTRRLRDVAPVEAVPTHGDLHLGQVLATTAGIRLIDFDRACLADAMEDLGQLYADVQLRSAPQSQSNNRQILDDLLSAYADAGGQIDRNRIDFYAASRLFELASEPFRHRHPDWVAETQRRLDAVDTILGRRRNSGHNLRSTQHSYRNGQASSTVTVDDPFGLVTDRQLLRSGGPLDPIAARDVCARLASYDGKHSGMELHSIRVLRHKPGRRALIEYAGKSRSTGETICILGKIGAKSRHQRLFDQQCRLWNAGFHTDSTDGISVAPPWSLVPEWNMWLQLKAQGGSCWEALRGRHGCLVATRIAQALCKLQSSNVSISKTHSMGDEMTTLEDRLQRAARQAPALAQRIGRLLQTCHNTVALLPTADAVPLHRDFYPDQVLVSEDRVVLVDFDLLACGDAAVDVGNFLGHLIEHRLRTDGHLYAYSSPEEAFFHEYHRLQPNTPLESIIIYTGLTLARHVFLCMNVDGRQANTVRVLAAAQQLLESKVRLAFRGSLQ